MNEALDIRRLRDEPDPTARVRPPRPLRLRIHSALRWLHIYISMSSLLIVFFFAITGITLNHPDWPLGQAEEFSEGQGTLPPNWRSGEVVDWVGIVEHLRSEHAVRAPLLDYRIDDFEGSLSFKSPGSSADIFFDPESGSYQISMVRSGPVGVLNELHRGANAGQGWRWVIDVTGALLALLSLTGIGLLLYLKKFRVSALLTMVAGSFLVLLIASWVI